MIEVWLGEPMAAGAAAIIRPIAADGSAVTPAMRRLDLTAGPSLAEQFSRLGELPIGSAAITGAGELGVDFVIHVAVRSQVEPATVDGIRRGLLNGLRRASEWGIQRLAVVPLGTGAGHLDVEQAAEAMVEVLAGYVRQVEDPPHIVVAVETDYEREVFERELRRASVIRRDEASAAMVQEG